MKTHAERRFNIVDENWIPVAGEGLVSLRRVFTDPGLKALGGSPVEKIALTKLLLAIAQTAYTPENDEEWARLGVKGMAEKALSYLEEKKDLFWLYGDRPFLQMPAISKAKAQNFSAVLPNVATGNTTVLVESQIEREMTDAEKALLLVFLTGFALGGKKADNSVVLSTGYKGKSNEKGNPSTAKPGPCLGFLGYLHNFLCGDSLCETIWLNLITQNRINEIAQFTKGTGSPPWERMPEGEDCQAAKELKQSLMGRLVPLCRFVLLSNEGIHYSEGILHPTHKDGGFDLSVAVDFSRNPKAIWTDPEKRPWRQLTSLLSFFGTTGDRQFDCTQLRIGVLRARKSIPDFRLWSGGLRVRSNAGEQYVSGSDDFVESEIHLSSDWLGEIWFALLKAEMEKLEEMANMIYGATLRYFRHLKADGKNEAALATNLFWQLSERKFQELIYACGDEIGKESSAMRRIFIDYANKAYNTYCPRETARQIEAWATSRPNLGRFWRH
jgi:CRISPR system Cascade subunit CasA